MLYNISIFERGTIMNEVLQVIEKRFSCRGYVGRAVEQDKLTAIAKAGLQAPSAMNLQPWQIIVINNKAIIDRLDDTAMEVIEANPDKSAYNRIMERGGKVFYNAPVLYLILKDADSKWADIDCGILTQNLCLAAASLDLDSVIVAMAGVPFNGPKGDELKKEIGWPDKKEFAMGVLVGYGNISKEPHETDSSKVTFLQA